VFAKAFKGTLGVGCALVVGLIVLIVIVGALSASGSRPSSATTPPLAQATSATRSAAAPTAAKTWVVVKEWAGTGIKNTEDFTVGEQWKIKWSSSSDSGIFQIYVYKSSDKSLVGLAANTSKAGSDESFQRGGGTFYLTINSANTNYKVSVEDFR
jgi:hypothetical protein